ncbi:hypothetical protein [Ruegeria faecimaris]|uniref:hypothetical protein n=1 Tax=Ruegeria faecimaris TaxID=686389 RepID=UPI00232BC26E|nr:hypothetical protein [Ruegeria faecimaris]
MTDNVVNSGIEDVLSSVKRLVSEEGRKVPDLVRSKSERKPGRLVLTDALRVGEQTGVETQPFKLDAEYSAEKSVKPMLLRACDVVAGDEAESATEHSPDPVAEEGIAKSLSAKIEALEAAIARTEDQWEPDGDSVDAYSGTPNQPLEWQPQDEAPDAETETVEKAVFVRDPEVSAAADTTGSEADAAMSRLDDDGLRSLIAQVVREELQGVLGERITRNVRKMVRREIYRALAEQKAE